MPSATMSRCGPAYAESWLLERTSPTSDRAAYLSATDTGLPLQLENALAHADGCTRRDGRRGLDALVRHVCPVRRPEVLDEPLTALREDPRVPRRRVVVVQDERAAGRAADEHGRRAQRDDRAA